MKKTERKQALGYIRVSTEEQAREGISLEAQEARIIALATAKGWDLQGVLEDRGFSGKNLKRPGVKELLDSCQQGKVDVVIVYKVDRLTRKQRDLWCVLEDVFEPNGVGFISITEPFDTTTATGKAFLGMLGTFAQLERDLVSERTIEALTHKKKKGEWAGRIPTGFKLLGCGKLVADQKMIERIQLAKKLRRKGKSLREISVRVGLSKDTVSKLVKVNVKSLKHRYEN